MDYVTGINNKTLKKSVGEVLTSADKNSDKSLDKKEIKDGIKGAASIFAKPFIGDKAVNAALKAVDSDNDGKISFEELDSFLQKKYNVTLEQAKAMNVKDAANLIQKINEENKKKNK